MQNFEYGIINDNKNFDLVSTELTDVEKNIVKGFIEREGVINLKNIPNKLGFIGHTKKISGIEMWCVFVKPPNVRGYKGCLIDEQSYEKDFEFNPYRVAVELWENFIPQEDTIKRDALIPLVIIDESCTEYLKYAYECFQSLTPKERKQTYWSFLVSEDYQSESPLTHFLFSSEVKNKWEFLFPPVDTTYSKIKEEAMKNLEKDVNAVNDKLSSITSNLNSYSEKINEIFNDMKNLKNEVENLTKKIKQESSKPAKNQRHFGLSLWLFLLMGFFIWYTSSTAKNTVENLINTEIAAPLNDLAKSQHTIAFLSIAFLSDLWNHRFEPHLLIQGVKIPQSVWERYITVKLVALTESQNKFISSVTTNLVRIDGEIHNLAALNNQQQESIDLLKKRLAKKTSTESKSGNKNSSTPHTLKKPSN